MKKHAFIIGILAYMLLLSNLAFFFTNTKQPQGTLINNDKTNPELSTSNPNNVTIISDGFNDIYWNFNVSSDPEIIRDGSGNIHVVWSDGTPGKWGDGYNNDPDGPYDCEIMYANYTQGIGWSNITVISDGFSGIYWNHNFSFDPDLAVDSAGNIHVVWSDGTPGVWGEGFNWWIPPGPLDDSEIMYVNYSVSTGKWSNITVISDGIGGYWNNNESSDPVITVDSDNNIHVVWEDLTNGIWKDNSEDSEIMYVNYTTATGKWSNATVISDGIGGYWNEGGSTDPEIINDETGNIYVVWEDRTEGVWGTDKEIMFVKYTAATGQWSNATIISDDSSGWNDGMSSNPSISIDASSNLHVVWMDRTDGIWGTDKEIMYSKYTATTSQWSNATIISDDSSGWNDDDSEYAEISIDDSGIIHVVWEDYTDGIWGNDTEIMYRYWRPNTGWSNIYLISDGYSGVYWNNGSSIETAIAVGSAGEVHVVWEDETPGKWGDGSVDEFGDLYDVEIMYRTFTLPSIDVTSPLDSSMFSTNAPSFTISLKGTEITSTWYTLNNGANNVFTGLSGTINQTAWSTLADGTVEIKFYASNSFGTASEDVSVSKNTTKPAIDIISPLNNSVFSTDAPTFNVSLVGANIDSTWYTLDIGITNYTFTALNGTINQTAWNNLSDGIVKLRFYVNNILGMIGFNEISVIKDTISPVITINNPSVSETFETAPEYNISIVEQNLDTIWYLLDGGTPISVISGLVGTISQTLWNSTSDGDVIIRFYANDTLSHVGSAEVIIEKDTQAPIITINTPNPGEEFGKDAPSFNVTVTDPNLDTVWLELDGSNYELTIPIIGTINQTAWEALPEGNYAITLHANDTLGHTTSENVLITKSVPSGGGIGLDYFMTSFLILITGGIGVIVVIVKAYTKKRIKFS